MEAMSRSGILPPRVASLLPAAAATGTVYARVTTRPHRFSRHPKTLQPPFGVRRDLVEHHAQPGAVVGGGLERGHEDRVERRRRSAQQEVGDAVNALALRRL